MACLQRRRIPSIIRTVSPCFTPPCVAPCRERSRPPLPSLFNLHSAPDTSTHLTPPPRKFPLPIRRTESVTVRRAMPTNHHEALPSLLYLCGGSRSGRFMWCLQSVSCHSFFPHPPPFPSFRVSDVLVCHQCLSLHPSLSMKSFRPHSRSCRLVSYPITRR